MGIFQDVQLNFNTPRGITSVTRGRGGCTARHSQCLPINNTRRPRPKSHSHPTPNGQSTPPDSPPPALSTPPLP
ncbi:hypothetical protein PCANC_05526 [Puccinia coronata f. sp. avenae]|uniref:Uncharacterized protein n=1 Tax=Puccinia coronata f. sp. avenae TaxID=200324 RepID=A0A2N5VP67_9BASI|nr:hypothetical protein PCANC_05526 [Puccinia coronata f. sp. avenae]